MLSLNTHQKLLDNFFEQKSKGLLHHAFIFRVRDAVFLDRFINSLCELILAKKVDNYEESPYITVASIDNEEIKVAEIKKIIKNCELAAHNDLAKIIIIVSLSYTTTPVLRHTGMTG